MKRSMTVTVLSVAVMVLMGSTAMANITIISGSDGQGYALPYGGQDPLTMYISPSSPMEHAAIARRGNTYGGDIPNNTIGGPASQGVSSSSNSDSWVKFYFRFVIPAEMAHPILNLDFSVDDYAKVYLNGVQLGGIFGQPQTIVHNVTTDDVSLFNVGGDNELMFYVINSPYSGWSDSGSGRGGVGDYMWVEFEGSVIPDPGTAPVPEPLTMVAVGMGIASLGGYIRRRRMATK